MAVWPEYFEQVLRKHCRLVSTDQGIDPDSSLNTLGVDSLDLVLFILDLEDLLEVQLPQDRMTPEVFATARSVWEFCAALAPGGGGS